MPQGINSFGGEIYEELGKGAKKVMNLLMRSADVLLTVKSRIRFPFFSTNLTFRSNGNSNSYIKLPRFSQPILKTKRLHRQMATAIS